MNASSSASLFLSQQSSPLIFHHWANASLAFRISASVVGVSMMLEAIVLANLHPRQARLMVLVLVLAFLRLARGIPALAPSVGNLRR